MEYPELCSSWLRANSGLDACEQLAAVKSKSVHWISHRRKVALEAWQVKVASPDRRMTPHPGKTATTDERLRLRRQPRPTEVGLNQFKAGHAEANQSTATTMATGARTHINPPTRGRSLSA